MAGLALISAMYMADWLMGLRPLPQLLQQPLLSILPGAVFGLLIDTLKHAGKVVEEAGLILALLAALSLLGGVYGRLTERWTWPYLSTALAAAGWLVVTLVLLPLCGDGLLGLAEGVQAPVLWAVLFMLYSVVLQYVYGSDRDRATDPARRRLLSAIPIGIAALSVAGLAVRLGPRWYSAVFQAPEQTAAGAASELTPVSEFYVVSKNFQDPVVAAGPWRLHVRGMVQAPATLDDAGLAALSTVTQYVTLECISNTVGGPQISTARFGGVPLRDLIATAGPSAGATAVNFTSADGYTETLPLAMVMAHPEIMVANRMNDAPLTVAHGFPARILIPGHYGMKGPKWLTDIEVAATAQGGYWEGQGWDPMAEVRTMSRIDLPLDGDLVPLRAVSISGFAFAGARGISRVEVSTDGGQTYTAATVKPALSEYTWSAWQLTWTPMAEGAHTLVVRARDGSGAAQSASQAASFPSGSSGYHRVAVNVLKT